MEGDALFTLAIRLECRHHRADVFEAKEIGDVCTQATSRLVQQSLPEHYLNVK